MTNSLQPRLLVYQNERDKKRIAEVRRKNDMNGRGLSAVIETLRFSDVKVLLAVSENYPQTPFVERRIPSLLVAFEMNKNKKKSKSGINGISVKGIVI